MSATNAKADLQARLDATPIPLVIESLIMLDATMADPAQADPAAIHVRAKLIDHLETHFPAAADAVRVAFEDAERREAETGEDVQVDYVAVLVAAIVADAKK